MKEIDVDGNVFFPDKQILNLMKTKEGRKFDRLVFNNDKNRIISFYNSKGFLDVRITKFDETEGEMIHIVIEEGFRTVINQIRIFGNNQVSDERIIQLLQYEKNMPLNKAQLSRRQIDIVEEYSGKGFIYVDVDYEFIDRETKYRKILYVNIEEKHRAYIRSINLDSLPETVRNVANYEIDLRSGMVYIPSAIYKSQQKLYNTGLFRIVNFHTNGIDAESESLDVYFTGTVKPYKWFSGGFLYQFPDRGKISLGWGNDNIMSNAENIMFETYLLTDIRRNTWLNGLISYEVPYLFKTLFSYVFEAEANQERNDYFNRSDISLMSGISRKWRNLLLSNNYRYKLSIVDTNVSNEPVRFQSANTNSVNFGLFYDRRDNPFYPTSGFTGFLSIEYAGGILSGYNNFTKYLVEFNAYRTEFSRLTIAGRIRGGIIDPYDVSVTRGISIDEQFKLGGFSSVRGIMTDSLGPLNEIGTHSGNMYININAETRILIYKMIGVSFFYDGGLLQASAGRPDPGDFVITGGLGIFVKTPIGPVRFDVARPVFSQTGSIQYYLNLGNSY
ncbi:MAG: BamA/TamA family outer membrane protein [bacterium]